MLAYEIVAVPKIMLVVLCKSYRISLPSLITFESSDIWNNDCFLPSFGNEGCLKCSLPFLAYTWFFSFKVGSSSVELSFRMGILPKLPTAGDESSRVELLACLC